MLILSIILLSKWMVILITFGDLTLSYHVKDLSSVFLRKYIKEILFLCEGELPFPGGKCGQ